MKFFRRNIKKILILFVLFIIYMYVANITLLPSSVIIMQGEKLNIFTLWGISISSQSNASNQSNIGENLGSSQSFLAEKTVTQASSNLSNSTIEEAGKVDLGVSLFNNQIDKTVTVSVIPKTTVIPLGNSIGLKLYTEGVLVVGMSEIEGQKPYENTGIETGDRIVEIDNKQIKTTTDLVTTVNSSQGKQITIKYVKENANEQSISIEKTYSKEETKETQITPAKTSKNEYKIGLWVRDAAAGVGTATFYEPSTKYFASLGHGITDIDTGDLISIANGQLVTANIVAITKGEKGTPGEIRGTIENGNKIGEVSKNTSFGIYGKITNTAYLNNTNKEVEVATRDEIQTGKAQIICEIENGKKKYYDIEIKRINKNNNSDNKSMLIKVTDQELLEKTRWNNTAECQVHQ